MILHSNDNFIQIACFTNYAHAYVNPHTKVCLCNIYLQCWLLAHSAPAPQQERRENRRSRSGTIFGSRKRQCTTRMKGENKKQHKGNPSSFAKSRSVPSQFLSNGHSGRQKLPFFLSQVLMVSVTCGTELTLGQLSQPCSFPAPCPLQCTCWRHESSRKSLYVEKILMLCKHCSGIVKIAARYQYLFSHKPKAQNLVACYEES